MKQIFISLLLITSLNAQDKQIRNIIILMDQDDSGENIGKADWWYLATQLESALSQKACPILINASLWSTFIEKRKSIEQLSKIADTDEQKGLDLYIDTHTA